MKKLLLALVVAAGVAMSMSSCAVISTQAGTGLLCTNVKEGAMVTSNTVGTKVGRSKATNILGLVTTGDASVATAAKNAGITKISHVDYNKYTVLGIFGSTEIIVYGD